MKNFLILAPAFFGLVIGQSDLLINLFFTILAFSILSSAIYIFNDLWDIEFDKQHPIKRKKGIASGIIPKINALFIGVFLLSLSLVLITCICHSCLKFFIIYALLNLAYSAILKHIPIVDIIILSFGYIIRIFIGGEVAGVPISFWLIILTYLLALFILLAKRKDDVKDYFKKGIISRTTVLFYNKINFSFWLQFQAMLIIVFYTAYAFADSTKNMFNNSYFWLSAIPVAIGISVFAHKISKINQHFEPLKVILESKMILFCGFVWMLLLSYLIY